MQAIHKAPYANIPKLFPIQDNVPLKLPILPHFPRPSEVQVRETVFTWACLVGENSGNFHRILKVEQ